VIRGVKSAGSVETIPSNRTGEPSEGVVRTPTQAAARQAATMLRIMRLSLVPVLRSSGQPTVWSAEDASSFVGHALAFETMARVT
jgi:hypothetical protein